MRRRDMISISEAILKFNLPSARGAFQFLGEFVASGLAAKPPIVVPVLPKPANAREGLCYLAPDPKSETHPVQAPSNWDS
jgi:hypothetical protein